VTHVLAATLSAPAFVPRLRVVMYGAHADDAPAAVTEAASARRSRSRSP